MKSIGLLAAAALGAASLLSAAQAQTPAPTSKATSAASAVPAGAGTTMLVLDASGSMWGQIQGRTKIDIAREAVGNMLQA